MLTFVKSLNYLLREKHRREWITINFVDYSRNDRLKSFTMKMSNSKDQKESMFYMKDLEAFIFYTLKSATKESLNRKISKGFKNKLTSKFISLVNEKTISKSSIHNSKETTINESNQNIGFDLLQNNNSFGNLIYNSPEENSLNIGNEGFYNLSYEGNLNNSFNSINNNVFYNLDIFQDDEDLYFKQYS